MKRRASSETEEMGTVCHVEDSRITCTVLLWGGEPWLEWRVQHPPQQPASSQRAPLAQTACLLPKAGVEEPREGRELSGEGKVVTGILGSQR